MFEQSTVIKSASLLHIQQVGFCNCAKKHKMDAKVNNSKGSANKIESNFRRREEKFCVAAYNYNENKMRKKSGCVLTTSINTIRFLFGDNGGHASSGGIRGQNERALSAHLSASWQSARVSAGGVAPVGRVNQMGQASRGKRIVAGLNARKWNNIQ